MREAAVTFKEFVAQTKIHADGAGDVMRLVRREPSLPEIGSLKELPVPVQHS